MIKNKEKGGKEDEKIGRRIFWSIYRWFCRLLQEILGHASYSTTADIYVHILGQVKLSQMNRLEDYLTDINMN